MLSGSEITASIVRSCLMSLSSLSDVSLTITDSKRVSLLCSPKAAFEKRKRDEQWYRWQTALKLVQGYGRSIRSKDDWATTYILDGAFGYFVSKNRNILPDWFLQAIDKVR
jgi:hypothetical protein